VEKVKGHPWLPQGEFALPQDPLKFNGLV